MSNLVLSAQNSIDTGATFYGDQDTGFELTKLADTNFSKFWRYTPAANVDGSVARFALSLGLITRLNHAAFCRTNLGQAAQVRMRAGTARLDVDFTDVTELTSPWITFGGGTNGTRTNEYGVMVSGGAPRYEHDRRFHENGFKYSEDLTQADWLESQCKKYADGVTVDFPLAGSILFQNLPNLYGDTYELKAQVRLVSGNGDFAFRVGNGAVNTTGVTKTATSTWQWFSDSITVAGNTISNDNGCVQKITSAGVLQIRRIQIRRGASNGKYRKTTSQRRYQRIGVISEAAATNSLLQSANVTVSPWSNAGLTLTANTTTAPDGTVSMDRVSGNGSGSIHQDVSLGGTTARAASVFFYAPTSTLASCALDIVWTTGGLQQFVTCSFNPSAGAFTSSSSSGATLKAAGVKDCGGGYFRAYVLGVGTDASNTVVRTQLDFSSASAAQVDVWGWQNEASYVTSYIPTTSAAVTRTVDTAVVEPTTWVPYVWNAAEGTVYHEAQDDDIPGDVSSREASYVQASGAAGNSVYSSLRTRDYLGQATAGGTTYQTVFAAVSAAVTTRAAYRYRLNDWKWALNGTLLADGSGSSTSQTVPTITAINFMLTPNMTTYLRRVTIWPTGKSNSDLQALTTSGPSAIDYDSGWSDAMQMSLNGDVSSTWGYDYDVIRTFTDRAVEWVRVGIYDPDKTDGVTPIECGRLFMGKLSLQPGINASFGLTDGWDDSATTFVETQNRRKVFNVLPKLREAIFDLPYLTQDEGALLHEMEASTGLSSEVLYLPDPSDLAYCQRYGFVGLMEKLDPLKYPLFNTRGKSYQIRKKR